MLEFREDDLCQLVCARKRGGEGNVDKVLSPVAAGLKGIAYIIGANLGGFGHLALAHGGKNLIRGDFDLVAIIISI